MIRSIAEIYERHGAAAISVLTDSKFFQGELRFLTAVRQHVQVPLLRKDFVIDPYQLYEARWYGADAVLLIAAALDVPQLVDLAALSQDIGLEPLVEVHTAAELEKALECSCRIIGVNNRDLRTFHTDVATTLDLLQQIPSDYLVVSESGLKDHATIARLADHGVQPFSLANRSCARRILGRNSTNCVEHSHTGRGIWCLNARPGCQGQSGL